MNDNFCLFCHSLLYVSIPLSFLKIKIFAPISIVICGIFIICEIFALLFEPVFKQFTVVLIIFNLAIAIVLSIIDYKNTKNPRNKKLIITAIVLQYTVLIVAALWANLHKYLHSGNNSDDFDGGYILCNEKDDKYSDDSDIDTSDENDQMYSNMLGLVE